MMENNRIYITKGFKIKKTLADDFADACDRVGVGQAATISRLMKQFIDDVQRERGKTI